MKKFITGAALLLISCSVLAQDTTKTKTDTTKIIVKSDSVQVSMKVKYQSRSEKRENRNASLNIGFGFDFGWNRFVKDDASKDPNLELEKGPDFTFNFIEGRVNLFSRYLRLKTALGLDYNTYHFKKDITLEKDKDAFAYQVSAVKFSKNLLRARYLRMPLVLAIRPNKKSDFEIAGGIEAGMLLNAKTKQISDENGKVKVKDDFNLNPYRYGYVVRLGSNGFNIYSRYYPTKLFDSSVAGTPKMKNFDIGISFGGI